MEQLKSFFRTLPHIILGIALGVILYLSATQLVNLLLAHGSLPEKSFIFKYLSISAYFYNNFIQNFVICYIVCLIYYTAFWIFKYLDFRFAKAPIFKTLNWNTRQFFLNLIVPALILTIMFSIHEEDSVKFIFPVTLLLAINNTRLLFRTSSLKKETSVQKVSAKSSALRRRKRSSQLIRRKAGNRNRVR
ncbi:hypothetical protein OfM1_16730 [Lactovum odontotermitis]